MFDKDILAHTLDEDLVKKRLKTLELRYCRLKYDVWKDLSSREVQLVQNLSIGGNDEITPEGIVFVGKIAERCKVKNLQLTSCYLGDEELEKISEAAPKDIEVLNLSKNKWLSGSAIKELRMKWSTLKELHVGGCRLELDDVEILKKDLPSYCTVYGDEDFLSTQSESMEVESSSTTGSSEECVQHPETSGIQTSTGNRRSLRSCKRCQMIPQTLRCKYRRVGHDQEHIYEAKA